ncbi:hypothetical protein DDT91_12475 [Algoriphagus sp. AK58]|nr:hypothetical protein [Algoriphagus sp. AK58]
MGGRIKFTLLFWSYSKLGEKKLKNYQAQIITLPVMVERFRGMFHLNISKYKNIWFCYIINKIYPFKTSMIQI